MFDTIWYDSLAKPLLTPPSWIFPPMWIFLYALIFIALLVYTFKPARNKLRGYVYFIIQMALNLLWSPIFFVMHDIVLALIIILLLDLFVMLTIKRFYTVSKFAGLILIPYLLWILFATYLNISFMLLNQAMP